MQMLGEFENSLTPEKAIPYSLRIQRHKISNLMAATWFGCYLCPYSVSWWVHTFHYILL